MFGQNVQPEEDQILPQLHQSHQQRQKRRRTKASLRGRPKNLLDQTTDNAVRLVRGMFRVQKTLNKYMRRQQKLESLVAYLVDRTREKYQVDREPAFDLSDQSISNIGSIFHEKQEDLMSLPHDMTVQEKKLRQVVEENEPIIQVARELKMSPSKAVEVIMDVYLKDAYE